MINYRKLYYFYILQNYILVKLLSIIYLYGFIDNSKNKK